MFGVCVYGYEYSEVYGVCENGGIWQLYQSGLGISILPELILRRVPYRIVAKELNVPAYRNIGLALRSKKTASLAVKRFLEYLEYRK